MPSTGISRRRRPFSWDFDGFFMLFGLLKSDSEALEPETEVEVLVLAYHSYVQVRTS